MGWLVFGGGLYFAYHYSLEARALSGTGVLAGIGEVFASLFFAAVAVVGALLLGIAACSTTMRWTERGHGDGANGASEPVDGSAESV